jgi:hypothetical protein
MNDKPAFRRGLVFLVAWLVWFGSGAAYAYAGHPGSFSLADTTPAFKIFFAIWLLVSTSLLFYAILTLGRSFASRRPH